LLTPTPIFTTIRMTTSMEMYTSIFMTPITTITIIPTRSTPIPIILIMRTELSTIMGAPSPQFAS
ncbi:MAG TPA: hypothetical protein VFZ99_01355, partial [Terriglobales bacterium]